MRLKNEQELHVTQDKLRILEERLAEARRESSHNPRAHELSLRALTRMMNQMKEEIARFAAQAVAR